MSTIGSTTVIADEVYLLEHPNSFVPIRLTSYVPGSVNMKYGFACELSPSFPKSQWYEVAPSDLFSKSTYRGEPPQSRD